MSVEDGAHIHLTEQRLKKRLEAVKRLREFAGRARQLDLFDEAFERLPVFVHQVAQASLMEGADSFEQLCAREFVGVSRGAMDEFDETPEVAAEYERLFELGLERLEQLLSAERRVEVLRERDDRLLIAVAQQSAGVLRAREDLRRLPHRAEAQDRKSTRLNSSHANISYAVFCLKKK